MCLKIDEECSTYVLLKNKTKHTRFAFKTPENNLMLAQLIIIVMPGDKKGL